MSAIKVDIYYKGNLRKSRIIVLEEEYALFMSRYGIDVKKDMNKTIKGSDEIEYYVPKGKLYGIDEDDKNLQIEEIIVDRNWFI